ncbi:protein indeterminate-domain 2 [Amborella trichopoda]|uniref:C2H2-type domain-containing protein n=1 Tax=Amborella trichopoda TaxID=13333 RepID=U5D0B8_AMBTC|nr:protein indeterminate-domain 2 [Amborella trichopoda]XP_020528408.1 protein indeterminate-domain 2 [Amborella trichopoda]ERN14837.1 hypothetical protein AMTR_s00032p00120910 [Amborella trichopoda]|eukprot:XP_006853370.1 protein indeterminate-domain 2 [Amborella trichopoda]
MAGSAKPPYFNTIREEDRISMPPQRLPEAIQPPPPPPGGSAPVNSSSQSTVQKKKRNLPGTPDPDAEVIALSPKTLMATNRFICEVCNKGFQREQNLQLHRRGHNLPWKLRQKSTKEVRRKVYLCPEPTCVHHDPSRALGDLTGIKKHFSRKHGEKKWKCEKCSKKYAVQSDWKAHSKTCGTREYRCDCGTLFSRRDSFITHRAFCDALAEESARLPSGFLSSASGHLYTGSNSTLNQPSSQMASLLDQIHNPAMRPPPNPNLLRLSGNSQMDHLMPPPQNPNFQTPPNPSFFGLHLQDSGNLAGILAGSSPDFQQQARHGFLQNPGNKNSSMGASTSREDNNNSGDNNPNCSSILMSEQLGIMANDQMNSGVSSLYSGHGLPQMSATALLQKAAQMGATTSSNTASLLRGLSSPSNTNAHQKPDLSSTMGLSWQDQQKPELVSGLDHQMRTNFSGEEAQIQDIMNSLAGGGTGIFGGGAATFGGDCSNSENEQQNHYGGFSGMMQGVHGLHQGGFLHGVVGSGSRIEEGGGGGGGDRLTRDFLGVENMARNMGRGLSQRDHHQAAMASLDSGLKSYRRENLQ